MIDSINYNAGTHDILWSLNDFFFIIFLISITLNAV